MKPCFLLAASIVIIVLAGCTSPDRPGLSEGKKKGAPVGNRILNLYDAFGAANDKVVFDFGFSALIEYNGKTILFDSGTDAEIFKKNVEALGIDLSRVDFAVASHSHADHISGFDYLLEVNPGVKIYLPKDFFGLGAPLSFGIAGPEPEKTEGLPEDQMYFRGNQETAEIKSSGRFRNADVEYVTENVKIADGISLVATSSPFLGYFSRYPNLDPQGNPTDSKTTFIGLPELSLVLDDADGQVVIVGCSHSTVEAIVRETIEYTHSKIALVMGGYHLIPYKSAELNEMAHRMKEELGVDRVAPSHCTGHLAFKILREVYGTDFIAAGLGSEISF